MAKRTRSAPGPRPPAAPAAALRWSAVERVLCPLVAHGVEFLLAGRLAVLLQGIRDSADDLAVWYRPTDDSIARLVAALSPLHPVSRRDGAPLAAASLSREALHGWDIEGTRVLLLDSLPGLESFDTSLERSRPLALMDATVAVLSLADLCAVQASPRLPVVLRMSPWLEGSERMTVEVPLRSPVGRFPESMFDDLGDQAFCEPWYGRALDAMGEPALTTLGVSGASCLRVLLLPTWGHPVCVRLDHDGPETRVSAARLSGQGGYDPGAIEWQRRFAVGSRVWADCERLLLTVPWARPERKTLTLDGTAWIVEHLEGGIHRGARITSPRPHEPLRRVAEHVLGLVGIQVPRRE